MIKNKLCPCGNKKIYAKCCYRFISGKELPSTAAELMRSRYTAYSLANIDYIESTMQGRALIGFDKASAYAWARSVKWTGLKVLSTTDGKQSDSKGTVEFIAKFKESGKAAEIHENSLFNKVNGRWVYMGDNC